MIPKITPQNFTDKPYSTFKHKINICNILNYNNLPPPISNKKITTKA